MGKVQVLNCTGSITGSALEEIYYNLFITTWVFISIVLAIMSTCYDDIVLTEVIAKSQRQTKAEEARNTEIQMIRL